MGSNFAIDLAGLDEFNPLTLEQKVSLHLQVNHYPPVPLSMVQPCVQAITAINECREDKSIDLPEGVLYKGKTSAPAWAIIEQHHLEAWVQDE